MRNLAVILVLALAFGPATAGERKWLGKARLWSNDEIGDTRDRWRTGAYTVSRIRGREWAGAPPEAFGALIELRTRGEVIAPASLNLPVNPADRPLVGVLQTGAATHMQRRGIDITLGADLVFIGPQTRMVALQSGVHQAFGYNPTPIFGSQLGDAVYPTVYGEIGREFTRRGAGGRRLALRPFAEGQIGVETFLRAGFDLILGPLGQGDLLVRDVVTGLRNPAIKGTRPRGISYVLGGDVAYVASSRYLPAGTGPAVRNTRARLRAGIYVEEGPASLFYGATWLGPEFVGQSSGQIVGSVTLRLDF